MTMKAPAGPPIPPGERILVGPRTLTGGASGGAAPPPPGRLLLRGCSGDDVRTLQARLQALGYLQSVPAGVFGSATDAAVRRFQADALGPAEADGLVGAITWGCLWPGPVAAPAAPAPSGPPGAPGRTYLRLRRGHRRDPYGLEVLQLEYIRDGAPAGSLEVCSGQPGAQRFRSGAESRAGSMEPLPEGRWRIDDIVWCAGRDVYGPAVFASGLGPVSTPIAYAGPGRTERSAIEIHLDWNRKGAPGTAGCIGIHTLADYRLLVSWLRERDPRDLYVDWGLGSCPPP
jgi:lysozyme